MSSSQLESIRFSSKLSPVKSGQLIRLSGTCSEEAKNFYIVLTGEEQIDSTTSTTEVQLGVKFQYGSSPYIVRNSYTAETGAWDDTNAEINENLIVANAENPIKPGGEFNIVIATSKDKFLIFVNSDMYCTYTYRSALDNIKRISVYGDVKEIHNCDHQMQPGLEKPKTGEVVGSMPVVSAGNCLVFHGQYMKPEAGSYLIELTDGRTGENVMIVTCENDGTKMSCRYRIDGLTQVTEPVVIEASDKFQIDYETPMKAAIGITSSHLYFVINGMLIFSESHKDLKFLERPLKYRITDDSLRIDEINVHSLEYELGSLRANQSKVNFVEDMKLHVPTTA